MIRELLLGGVVALSGSVLFGLASAGGPALRLSHPASCLV
jgi:hypothetical protein